jgi:hypothetical protein
MQRNSGRIMAEFEKQARKARAAGSLRVPHPKEAKIREQNAERIARRREAAAMFERIQETSAADLSREGDERRVGGRFERLQKVPKRKPRKSADVSFGAIAKMLKSLSFDPREIEFFRQSGLRHIRGAMYRPRPRLQLGYHVSKEQRWVL